MDVDNFLKGKTIIKTPTFWRRTSAFIFDLLILYFLVYETVFVALLGRINLRVMETNLSSLSKSFVVPEIFIWTVIFAGILSWAYFALLEYSAGWTIGMRIMNLKVSGSPSFSKCLLRNSYILPFFPFTLFWVADPLFLIFRRRRLLEIISATDTTFDGENN